MEEVRLIDANALVDKLPKVDLDHDERITKSGVVADMVCLISNAPTIEAEPVRHGRWERRLNKYYCTSCGTGYRICNGGPNAFRFKRCPNCGAKMDAKEEPTNA